VENKTVEMVVKDLLLADNRKKKKKKGTLNSYNFGIVEDTHKLFAPNREFSGSVNLTL